MADSFAKDVVDALLEDAEQRLPDKIVDRISNADNIGGIIGILFDLYSGFPNLSSPFFLLVAERLKGRGGLLALFGEFVETIPATSRLLRRVTGKTEESARADLVQHWHNFSNNPSIGALMATTTAPAGTTAAPAAPPVTPAASPPPRRIEDVVSDAFNADEQQIIICIAEILRKEGKPGVDIVREVEGDSSLALIAWLDCVHQSPSALREQLTTSNEAMAASDEMDLQFRRGIAESPAVEAAWARAAAMVVRTNRTAIEFAFMGYNHRHPQNGLAAKVEDILDGLNLLAGVGVPRGKFAAMQSAVHGAITGAQIGIGVVAFTLLCCLVLALVATYSPESLHGLTTLGFYGLEGIALIVITIGFFRRTGRALVAQATALVAAMGVFPIIAGVGFLLATMLTKDPQSWVDFTMTWVLVNAWNLVSVGLAQKGVSLFAHIQSTVERIFGKSASEQFGKLAKENLWLTRIGTTIAFAVSLVWVFVFPLNVYGVGNPDRMLIIGVLVLVALPVALTSTLQNSTDINGYAAHVREDKKATDRGDYKAGKIAMRYVLPITLVVMTAVTIGGIAKSSTNPGRIGRVAEQTSAATDKAFDLVDKKLGINTKPKSAMSAANDAYCKAHPTDHTYPCK